MRQSSAFDGPDTTGYDTQYYKSPRLGEEILRTQLSMIGAMMFGLTGCVSTSSVMEVGRDTYTVSATADGFRTAAAARESAYETGHAKCRAEGKRLQMVHETSERTRLDIDTTITVTFQCLDERDADYRRIEVRTAPTTVIEDRRR